MDGKIREGAPPAQLYNLAADPRQQENLYSSRPDIVEELEKALKSTIGR
ncbi:MAG: hypothetical protein GVY26_08355 [Bacteroidetes bacterium]|nr:hypothetical protein [Bacteroidota bacterium]